MKSRERVMCTFAHETPDRVPIWIGSSDEFWLKSKKQLNLNDEELRVRYKDDFRRVFARYAGPEIQPGEGAVSRTIFGIDRVGLGYGQPLSHPLANATLRDIEEYPWPDPAWMDVSHIREEALQWRDTYAILGGDWSPFWHDLIDLMGMETMYLKMYEEPELVDAILQHLVDFDFEVSRRIFEAAADVIDISFFGNDLGSQNGPLLSPDSFERFLMPHMRRIIGLGHDYGLKVQMHCCGGIAPLIPQLISAGLDALHAIQPDCAGMDLCRLKADFGGKIVLNGAIDSHHILIKGTADFARTKTAEVLQIMMPGGGYIAGASHDSILEETPVENILAMVDAVEEFGVYAK